MNFARGQNVTNTGALALAAVASADLRVRSYAAATHYVIDVQGYFIDPEYLSPGVAGAVFVPVTPCRVVDTRRGGGALGVREVRSWQVGGAGGAFAGQGGRAGGCGIQAEA